MLKCAYKLWFFVALVQSTEIRSFCYRSNLQGEFIWKCFHALIRILFVNLIYAWKKIWNCEWNWKIDPKGLKITRKNA